MVVPSPSSSSRYAGREKGGGGGRGSRWVGEEREREVSKLSIQGYRDERGLVVARTQSSECELLLYVPSPLVPLLSPLFPLLTYNPKDLMEPLLLRRRTHDWRQCPNQEMSSHLYIRHTHHSANLHILLSGKCAQVSCGTRQKRQMRAVCTVVTSLHRFSSFFHPFLSSPLPSPFCSQSKV